MYALTTHQIQVERRERVIETISVCAHHTPDTGGEERESHRDNQVYALTTHQIQVERRESHRANQCMRSPHTRYRWRGERVIETIKCMRSPQTSYRWRGERVIEPISVCAHHTPATGGEERESHRDNQVYALTTHQIQVERRESHRANQCMRSPHTRYRWRGERVIEPISVCAHHTPDTGGEERES